MKEITKKPSNQSIQFSYHQLIVLLSGGKIHFDLRSFPNRLLRAGKMEQENHQISPS